MTGCKCAVAALDESRSQSYCMTVKSLKSPRDEEA